MARVPHPTKPHPAMTYKEPASVRFMRYGMTAFWVMLVLALLYVGAWFVTSMSLRSGVQDWFAARQAEGYIAKYDDKRARISGFPFSVKATIKDVTLAPPVGPSGERPWVWAPKHVTFSITPLPWSVSTLTVDLSARQVLTVNRSTYSGKAKTFALTLDWMSDGLPADLRLLIEGLSLNAQKQGAPVSIDKLTLQASRLSNGDYDFDLNTTRASLPSGLAGMGRRVDEIIIRGLFNQNFAQNSLDRVQLGQWRDAGGTVEINRIQVAYGPLLVQGNGTLALDGGLQPVGAFSARIQGFFETLEALRRARVVRGPDASMAKVVLGMLLKYPENGGQPSISLPISIQDQAVFAGPVRLINIPTQNW
ncbi:MAG: DUF2125 domain-containing protein [Methylocystaceae bacterium]|nr:DUF2125 domain-containing protein [Methylocystaceae bacterium]